MGNCCGKILQENVVGKCCGKSCGKRLWEILQENLVGNSCGKSFGKILLEILRENPAGQGGGEKANLTKGSDLWKFSIWNRVMGSQPIRI